KDSKKRMMDRGALDRIEQRDDAFRARVYDGFQQIAASDPERVQIVQANRSIEAIHQDLVEDVITYLEEKERFS
ncbi:MAG: dTMP kinase, partial [Exiguobacterium acetylicum]